MKDKYPISRLTIEVTEQQHQALKAMDVLEGKTIKQYELEKLFPDGASYDQAWQKLKSLLDTRINEAIAGNVSAKSVLEILDEELRVGK